MLKPRGWVTAERGTGDREENFPLGEFNLAEKAAGGTAWITSQSSMESAPCSGGHVAEKEIRVRQNPSGSKSPVLNYTLKDSKAFVAGASGCLILFT